MPQHDTWTIIMPDTTDILPLGRPFRKRLPAPELLDTGSPPGLEPVQITTDPRFVSHVFYDPATGFDPSGSGSSSTATTRTCITTKDSATRRRPSRCADSRWTDACDRRPPYVFGPVIFHSP